MLALSRELSHACSGETDIEEQLADASRSNAALRRELLYSRDEREKLHDSLDAAELKIAELTRQNKELRKVAADREESAVDLQKQLDSVEERIAAAEQSASDYRDKVSLNLTELLSFYEASMADIGVRVPTLEKDCDLFQWFKKEIASLPFIFASLSDHLVGSALDGSLNMLRLQGCDHASAISKAAAGHGLSALTTVPSEVTKRTRRIMKTWWLKCGRAEAIRLVRVTVVFC